MLRGGQLAAAMKNAYWSQWSFAAYMNYNAKHAFLSKFG